MVLPAIRGNMVWIATRTNMVVYPLLLACYISSVCSVLDFFSFATVCLRSLLVLFFPWSP